MDEIINCHLVIPGGGIFSPIFPVIWPDFAEVCLPGGTLDESKMDCVAMAWITQWALADCFFPRGGGDPSHRSFSHSQRSHNMRLMPFKGSQVIQCTLGNPNARRR